MPNREKVIKGLEALDKAMSLNQCYTCSHEFINGVKEFGTNIITDAIALLKEDPYQFCGGMSEKRIELLKKALALYEFSVDQRNEYDERNEFFCMVEELSQMVGADLHN